MERNQIYKCGICGNIVEVLFVGGGTLVCCGQPMELQAEKINDTGAEKHVPIIEKTDKGILVKIGSVPHPMEESHYIQWVELIIDEKRYKEFLKPNNQPKTLFCVAGEKIQARIYCNIHGLWKG